MKWNELLAKNLRKYIKEHPDEFPSTGNDEDIEEGEFRVERSSQGNRS